MNQSNATTSRRLATVETILDVAAIPDADAIVRARVRGWDVVVKKGEFEVGDGCVYFEVDSMLDVADERFAFLAARGVRTDADGRQGHVLRTAKLRGQYSQGLALPLASFPELAGCLPGDDVTAALGVLKWDPPLPAELSGQLRGPRPGWIPATDEERVQNLAAVLDCPADWIATEKVDGTSMTAYVDPESEVDGVCSRNYDLLPADGNTLWRLARELDLHALLRKSFPDGGRPCRARRTARASRATRSSCATSGSRRSPSGWRGTRSRAATGRSGRSACRCRCAGSSPSPPPSTRRWPTWTA